MDLCSSTHKYFRPGTITGIFGTLYLDFTGVV